MKNAYSMRILLILCDIVSDGQGCCRGGDWPSQRPINLLSVLVAAYTQTEHQQSIRELSKHAVINDLSVFVAWS